MYKEIKWSTIHTLLWNTNHKWNATLDETLDFQIKPTRQAIPYPITLDETLEFPNKTN